MKKLLRLIGLSLVAVVGLVLVRTLMFTAPPVETPDRVAVDVDGETVTAHMVEAIRFKTVSVSSTKRRTTHPS